MTLPSSGTISASMVNIELGRASSAPFNINDPAVRGLAGKPSGPISFGDLRGKSDSPKVVNPLSPTPRAVSLAYNNSPALADITFSNGGTWVTSGETEGNSGSWLISGDASKVSVRLTPTAGAFGNNNASSWTPIGSARAVITATENDRVNSCTYTIELYDNKLGKIIGTTTGCYMEANCDPGPAP